MLNSCRGHFSVSCPFLLGLVHARLAEGTCRTGRRAEWIFHLRRAPGGNFGPARPSERVESSAARGVDLLLSFCNY